MALNVGSRIAHYDVTALIGQGGMGQVYQATDTKLHRQVALKILPEAFATDPDRLARFQREAQVLASLNHPNIAAIYGIEETDDTRALVLELVEGPTLADRISKGPIPVDEALPIAKQIAEALEAAHEAGVIHRDLKPANIKVREDGTVKVLDFGLAKALDPSPSVDPSQSPTLTAAATQMGVIMGTAAYMSPEQARGKPVDRRADIWAFGVVLYEMLTGQRAFEGDDVSLTLADVMRAEPAWGRLPEDLSPALDTYLKRCLEKESRQRVQAIGDMRLAMAGAFDTTVSTAAADIPALELRVWQRPLPLVLGALLLVVASGFATQVLVPPGRSSVERFSIPLASNEAFSLPRGPLVAISPDGSHIAYTANDNLWLRSLDTLQAIELPETERANSPFFSADSRWVGFWADGQLRRVAVSGGLPLTIADEVENTQRPSWGPNELIVFDQPEGIMQVPGEGGTPELLIQARDGERIQAPEMLPGGEWVLFTVRSSEPSSQIVVQSVTSGDRAVVIQGGRAAHYVSSGHLVYAADETLFGVPFDVDSREVTGAAQPLVDGVRQALYGGPAHFSVSADGSLVYVPGSVRVRSSVLTWVDRNGVEEDLLAPQHLYDTHLMQVAIETEPTFGASTPEPLFDRSPYYFGPFRQYDLSPEGDRFLLRKLSDDRTSFADDFNGMILVQNFLEELKARVPIP